MENNSRVICLPYCPHKAQELVHEDKHRYKTIVCGRRFGKTIMLINELIKQAIIKPTDYWYISPTYKQSKLIAWEILKRYAIPEIRTKLNESELSVETIGGGKVRLMGADNPENLRGSGLGGAGFDEFADIKRNVWQEIVRPMLTDQKGWAWFVGTPKGKINILHEQFIKDKDYNDSSYIGIDGEGIDSDDDYKSFRFLTIDNPYIDKIEVEKARREMSPQYFRQEYEASFEDYTGIIYKELTEQCIINTPPLDAYWQYYVGIDTGRHTAITFVAIDKENRAYEFDEIYDYDGIVRDIATQIKFKCQQYKIKPTYIIDSASQVKREYEQAGLAVYDSEKDLDNSINIIRNRLKSGRLFFDREKCRISIMEHKGYVWDEKTYGRDKKPYPIKENDHTVSAMQYVLNWPSVRKAGEGKEEKEYKKSLDYFTKHVKDTGNEKWQDRA